VSSAALGRPIVISGNLRKCKYIIHDAAKERLWEFSLPDVLSLPRGVPGASRVFAGITVYAVAGVCGVCAPKEEEMKTIVESGGGSWVTSLNKKNKTTLSRLLIIVPPPAEQPTNAKSTKRSSGDRRVVLNSSEVAALRSSELSKDRSNNKLKVYFPELLFLACLRQRIDFNHNFEEYDDN
jgi:hypothetical protein